MFLKLKSVVLFFKICFLYDNVFSVRSIQHNSIVFSFDILSVKKRYTYRDLYSTTVVNNSDC